MNKFDKIYITLNDSEDFLDWLEKDILNDRLTYEDARGEEEKEKKVFGL